MPIPGTSNNIGAPHILATFMHRTQVFVVPLLRHVFQPSIFFFFSTLIKVNQRMHSNIPCKRDKLRLIQATESLYWLVSECDNRSSTLHRRALGRVWETHTKMLTASVKSEVHRAAEHGTGETRGSEQSADKPGVFSSKACQHLKVLVELWPSPGTLRQASGSGSECRTVRGEKHEVITGAITRWALNCGVGDTLNQSLTWTGARRKSVLGWQLLIRTKSIQLCGRKQHIRTLTNHFIQRLQTPK